MARLLKHTSGHLRTLSRLCNGATCTSLQPMLMCQSLSSTSSGSRMKSGRGSSKDEELSLRYEKEYAPTTRYTSTPMVEEEPGGGAMTIGTAGSEQTFGTLSDRFKHKYQPLGTDVLEELEEAELGEEWVRPTVKRNTPIWYGNQMKALVKEGKLAEAIEMLEVTMLKEAKVYPTEFNFNVLIGACGRAGYTDKAFKLFNRMKERGLLPSSVTYTALFNACSQSPWPKDDGLTRLKKLHHLLLEKSVKVNLITHHSMMKAYAKCGDLEMTFKLFRHLLDSGMQLMPKSFSFLLFACAEDKEAGFLYAVEAWRQMLIQGIKPDVYIYNLLLRTTRDCSLGDMETANRVLLRTVQPRRNRTLALAEGEAKGGQKKRERREKRMQRMKDAVPVSGKKAEMVVIEPLQLDSLDERFSNMATELPSFDDVEEPAFFDEPRMQTNKDRSRHSRPPNKPIAEDSLDSPTAQGTHWWDANGRTTLNPSASETSRSPESTQGILNTVTASGSRSIQPRPSAALNPSELPNMLDISSDFSNVQSLAVISSSSDRLAILGGAVGVLDNMAEHGVRPDVKGLSILAEILRANKQEENRLLDYVVEEKVKVDIDFYNVFIRRRTRRRDLNGAKAVLGYIGRQNLFPNLRTYVNLAAGCAKPEEGFQLLREMEEARVTPNCHLYGALIGSTQRHRDFQYLVDVLQHMEESGVIPNERVIGQLERIAGFGQDKVAEARNSHRPIKKNELNKFRGFYNLWLSRMKVEVPQHPWSKFKKRDGDDSKMKFHETAI